jgi:hypothetical protein
MMNNARIRFDRMLISVLLSSPTLALPGERSIVVSYASGDREDDRRDDRRRAALPPFGPVDAAEFGEAAPPTAVETHRSPEMDELPPVETNVPPTGSTVASKTTVKTGSGADSANAQLLDAHPGQTDQLAERTGGQLAVIGDRQRHDT